MTDHSSRIDSYIENAAGFAKPILQHLRAVIHKACPGVVENWKWSFPHFDYAGSSICSMAAFKGHCAFTFRLAALMSDPDKVLAPVGERSAMGNFGQIKSIGDLPDEKILIKYIEEAMALSVGGAKPPRKDTPALEAEVPVYLMEALQKNTTALNTFNAFSNSHKKEYLQWIVEAKTEPTRIKRITTMIEWLEQGKDRNWKYKK
jgi:uncharacterized protein YdeI (YjbR/CyaY-like superfamily)